VLEARERAAGRGERGIYEWPAAHQQGWAPGRRKSKAVQCPTRRDAALHRGLRVAGAGYLETLGTPLIRGRLFDGREGAGSARDRDHQSTMARQFWPDEDAIGRQMKLGPANVDAPCSRGGVIGDVRWAGLDVDPLPSSTCR